MIDPATAKDMEEERRTKWEQCKRLISGDPFRNAIMLECEEVEHRKWPRAYDLVPTTTQLQARRAGRQSGSAVEPDELLPRSAGAR